MRKGKSNKPSEDENTTGRRTGKTGGDKTDTKTQDAQRYGAGDRQEK